MAYVGTLKWADQTGGRIGLRDRVELLRLAGLTAILDGPAYLGYRWRHRVVPAPAVGLQLNPPATPAATSALAQLSKIAPDYLVKHSVRTYWFSRWIGDASNLQFDDELLYLASLAHEVGLCTSSSPICPVPSNQRCFSIRGARWAAGIARNDGWSPARIDQLQEAITLNLNGRVPLRLGVEAHLMMRGVLLDVTGFNAVCLDPGLVQALFQQVARLDQRTQLPPAFSAEARRQPGCRAHFAVCALGFGFLMRHPPNGWT